MSTLTPGVAAFKTSVAGQPTLFFLGPVVQFLATPEQTSEQFTVVRTSVAPGVVVPLHRHRETEWLLVLEGTVQVWADRQEQPQSIEITAQESVLIPSQARHAIRNTSDTPAFVILVAAARIGHLFEQIATPLAPGEPFFLLPTSELINSSWPSRGNMATGALRPRRMPPSEFTFSPCDLKVPSKSQGSVNASS